jgi:hypothetical protein
MFVHMFHFTKVHLFIYSFISESLKFYLNFYAIIQLYLNGYYKDLSKCGEITFFHFASSISQSI